MNLTPAVSALSLTLLLAACATPEPAEQRTVTIQRTAYGVPHISAPNFETLAYGVAYAHAQDNVCLTAHHLVTARAERSLHFGPSQTGLLGQRVLPNEVIDLFITAHMDDAALAQAWAKTSADAQALARGYVAGYNRYLADNTSKLPEACANQAWVQPMTLAQYRRITEIGAIQAGIGLFADGLIGAQRPTTTTAHTNPDVATVLAAARELGLTDSPLGSNAWAFGKDSTQTGRGLLVGNPHFPWGGVNRFWQMHLTVPGKLDVMGASIGHSAVVQIGFNGDVAWSHTVSTGKRFTVHELTLTPADPTTYLIDGQAEKMTSRVLRIATQDAGGKSSSKEHTVWSTRWGPVVVAPRLGLTWTATRAYALQDANSGNARSTDTWLQLGTSRNVADMQRALQNLGLPFVNTIAADRKGNALYADMSVVPDVDAAQLARCAPSAAAAALLRSPAGIVVLDGSKSSCAWQRDATSAVPGLTPAARLPKAVRSDWVHNSNDSYVYTHPAQTFSGISPLMGDDVLRRPRTRSGLIEIAEMVARGPVTLASAQTQLLSNRNLTARVVLPDLLAACAIGAGAPTQEAKDGCAALRGWDRHSNLESRGAHLFREFWRAANAVPGVYRVPFDKAQPVATPLGLKMDDAAVATKVWDALSQAVQKVRAAGYALDAPLGTMQFPGITSERIPLHGGEDMEGVLNYLGRTAQGAAPGLTPHGHAIDYGSSYIQTVTFDERGPVAQAVLTYGQSTNPASPHANDQMRLYSKKQWNALPFHAEDVARGRVGDVLKLTRP
jgi:acyl-homoserine-lactone acylase